MCATVESIPLITASILSKKLAAGLEYLVMDLKCGNGAFMTNLSDAEVLARLIVDVANAAGTKTSAVITDMNQVLGTTVGNSLEISEAIDYLNNKNVDYRLDEITKTLCAQLLVKCGRCVSINKAKDLVQQAILSGKAMEKFAQMIALLGGPNDFAEHSEKYLPHSKYIKPVLAPCNGHITKIDTRKIGLTLIKLNGGRTHPNQKLDLATGFSHFVQIGDKVDISTPLALIHYQDEKQYELAQNDILEAIEIGNKCPTKKSPILMTI